MDTMESMVGDLDTWMPDTWWATHTWWAAHIHGVEPTCMVDWPASRPALVGGQGGAGPGPAQRAPLAPQPGPSPKLAGWLARPPIQVPHHGFHGIHGID